MQALRTSVKGLLRALLGLISGAIHFAVSLAPEKLLLAVFGIGVAGIAFFAGLQHYTTSQPKFCMTCHRQQSHSEFWRDSLVHPSSVGCVECHAKHGEILPRDYSADSKRTNVQCVRCHENMRARENTAGF